MSNIVSNKVFHIKPVSVATITVLCLISKYGYVIKQCIAIQWNTNNFRVWFFSNLQMRRCCVSCVPSAGFRSSTSAAFIRLVVWVCAVRVNPNAFLSRSLCRLIKIWGMNSRLHWTTVIRLSNNMGFGYIYFTLSVTVFGKSNKEYRKVVWLVFSASCL